MDVNGTRFHLIKGREDWARCREDGESSPGVFANLSLERDSGVLSLNSLLVLFVSARGRTSLDPQARRGACPDIFDNWYWISHDRQKIFWRPAGSKKSQVFWSPDDSAPACAVPSGDFAPARVEPPPAPAPELCGLAVTSGHYLVAGNVSGRGLFVFDLHAGGAPLLLTFPEGVPFRPFDMSPAPWGGVWVLDRVNRAYWGLDRQFRVLSQSALLEEIEPEEQSVFHVAGGTATIRPARRFPRGFVLPPQVLDPIGIEALPDGDVLILDSPAYLASAPEPAAPSRVHRYRMGQAVEDFFTLSGDTKVIDEATHEVRASLSVVGYDFAFIPETDAARRGTLYVVTSDGNQTVAFTLDFDASPNTLEIKRDFLPMHFYGSRALVAHRQRLYYDVLGGDTSNDRAVRWTPLYDLDEHRYEREGTLVTHELDGKTRDCVWHRMFLDACIPAETTIQVWTRAHNERALLGGVEWRLEPTPYLRGAGAESPYYKPFAHYGAGEMPENTGTWELLFQEARGRFLEIKLALGGNGRTTPHLHALRAYYPRFSYAKNYLPAVYLEEPDSASFLERFLANEEGFYSEIEGKIGNVGLLFDARSAPAEALDWLAAWVGIVLDPLWADIQRRREDDIGAGGFGGNGSGGRLTTTGARVDRRRLFIRFARKLYERRGTATGIRFALQLLLDPCLEATLRRLKTAAVRPLEFPGFLAELDGYGLPHPTPVMSEEEFEDLLYDYALAPQRPSKVRIVEHYLTRGGRRRQAGDASVEREGESGGDEAPDAFAHQFSVLVPETLTPEEEAMIERITGLEKPAHTQFDVRRYWDFFRVGEARLGVDTILGEESRFLEIVLGNSYLAEGYLYPSHPADVGVRVISDRDRVGDLPPL